MKLSKEIKKNWGLSTLNKMWGYYIYDRKYNGVKERFEQYLIHTLTI